MPLIVDTYNVLHTTGVLPPDLAGMDLGRLVDAVAMSRYRTDAVTLVCDGVERPGRVAPARSGIRVHYAGHRRTADEVIGRMVDRSTAPRRLTVVSSDREVQRSARRRRCRTLSSADFLTAIAADLEFGPPPETPAPMATGPVDVDHWLGAFGLRPGDLVLPAAAAVVEPAVAEPESIADDGLPELPPSTGNLPADLIAEAERLLADARGNDGLPADLPVVPEPEVAPEPEAAPEPVPEPTPPSRPAVFEGFDELAERLELAPEPEERPVEPEPEPVPPPPAAPSASEIIPPAPRAGLSDELIREAEALLEEFDDRPPG